MLFTDGYREVGVMFVLLYLTMDEVRSQLIKNGLVSPVYVKLSPAATVSPNNVQSNCKVKIVCADHSSWPGFNKVR